MNRRQVGLMVLAGGAVVSALGGCAAFRSAQVAREAEKDAPPIGRFLQAPQRVHYIEQGEGRPILLLHGASGNLRDWTFGTMALMSDYGRAIAVDRPGFGYSDPPPDPKGWLPEAQTEAMRRFIRQLTDEKPILVGHSWSAALALDWALRYPDEIAGVLSVAGVTTPWPKGVGFIYDLAAAPVVGPAFVHTIAPAYGARIIEGAINNIFAPNPPPPDYAERVGASLALRPASMRFNAKSLSDLKPSIRALHAWYDEITTPIEALHGLEDRVLPFRLHALGLQAAAPTANLVALEGVGHMPHHARPEEIRAAMARLLARI